MVWVTTGQTSVGKLSVFPQVEPFYANVKPTPTVPVAGGNQLGRRHGALVSKSLVDWIVSE